MEINDFNVPVGFDLARTMIVPLHLFPEVKAMKIIADRYVPDDKIYMIDQDGRILCYALVGK